MDDIEGVRRLVFVYSQLLDDTRYDEWEDLFTEDAVFTVWGNVYAGRQAIRDGIGGMSRVPGQARCLRDHRRLRRRSGMGVD